MVAVRVIFIIMLLWLVMDAIISSRWFLNFCMKLRNQFYKKSHKIKKRK